MILLPLRCASKKALLRKQWSLEGSFTVLLDGFVPRKNVVKMFGMPLGIGVWKILEEVLEVLEWVQSVVQQIPSRKDHPAVHERLPPRRVGREHSALRRARILLSVSRETSPSFFTQTFRDNLVRKVRSEVFFITDKNPGA